MAGLPCPPGKACVGQGIESVGGAVDCDAGYFCIGGATGRRPQDGRTGERCPPGHYCPAGAEYPTPCPIGFYSPTTGEADDSCCTACDPGKICKALGATDGVIDCDAGYSCPDQQTKLPCTVGHKCPQGSATPTACPAGEYQPHTHQSVCLECPEGYHCTGLGGVDAVAAICPAGRYCPAGSETGIECAAGTFSPFPGLEGPEGDSTGRPGCTPCVEGYYCDVDGIAALPTDKPCGAGNYCPAGTIQDSDNECPAGSYCPA